MLVHNPGVGEVEPALDKDGCQEEDEQDDARDRQHVDQGLLHLQAC